VLNEAKSTLDKAVGKGVIHKNKANRLKSRLAKKAAAVAAAKK
jgi:ribosomal protein S20